MSNSKDILKVVHCAQKYELRRTTGCICWYVLDYEWSTQVLLGVQLTSNMLFVVSLKHSLHH